MLKKCARKFKNQLIDRKNITEELRKIDESDIDYITPSGKVYSEYEQDKFLQKTPHKNQHNGYIYVAIHTENGERTRRLHRLVAKAFIPNPNNYPVVNHKDENPQNNNVDNLEWCTHYYNVHYGRADELRKQNQYGCKAVLKYSLDGELLKEYPRIMDAVRENPPATRQNIRECCKGKIKTCAGYKWKFK